MQSGEFDDLLKTGRQVGRLLAALLDGVTEEDIDVRRALRNYPVWTVAFAAGAGALGGWWLARMQQPQVFAPQPLTPGEAARALLTDAGARLRERANEYVNGQPEAREYIDKLLPEGLTIDVVADQAGAAARSWMDTVLEPKLKEGLDQVTAGLSEGRFGGLLHQVRHFVELDEPDEPQQPQA